jgi:hypothetical protein
VTERTIHKWKAKYVEFRASLKIGKDQTDDAVERAVIKGITGYYVEVQEMNAQGIVRTVRKGIPGNPNAGLKWLAVRRPDKPTDQDHRTQAYPEPVAR